VEADHHATAFLYARVFANCAPGAILLQHIDRVVRQGRALTKTIITKISAYIWTTGSHNICKLIIVYPYYRSSPREAIFAPQAVFRQIESGGIARVGTFRVILASEYSAASNAYANDIDPTMRKIEQVRVE
jgi:hypothetical protein